MISKFLKHVIPGVIKPLHALWNEIIAFLFFCFTALAGFYVYRALRSFDGTVEGLFRIALPGLFALVMAYFCFSSFYKARKISRS
jgi:hypothetical protein